MVIRTCLEFAETTLQHAFNRGCELVISFSPARALSRAAVMVWIGLIFGNPISHAQDETETGQGSPNTKLPDVLTEGTLPIPAELYLRDENGTPIFVPNVSMKEFLRLRDQAQGAPGGEFAPFQFEKITVNANVTESYADLQGKFEVQLGPSSQSANIPLSFGTCQLGIKRPVIDSQDTVSQFLADATGYRWILLSKAASTDQATSHSISLAGKTRVTQEADRHSLRIALPIYPCQLKIRLPASAIDERVRSEDILQRNVSESGVELIIDSRGGEFTLTWRNREMVTRVASVESQSRTTFEILDPRQTWKATTNLTVRWFGKDASDQFRIRLPAGARWRAFPQPDFDRYSVTSVEPTDGFELESVRDISELDSLLQPIELLVKNFDPGQAPSIELTLEWEWVPRIEGNDSLIINTSIPGPSVTDVSVHSGTIDCVYPASYSVVFNEGNSVRLIQQRRVADAFGSQQLQFQFTAEPFTLDVSFRVEQSLPTVRPTYQVSVDENKLVMTAWLDCSFDINQQRLELGMIFGDWILQENTAKALNSPDSPFASDGDVLTVLRQEDGSYVITGTDPDSTGFSSNRNVNQVWRLIAEQSWTPDENNELEFRVPEIIRGRSGGLSQTDHGSGALIVKGSNDILLQWKETASTGLLSDSFSTEYQKFVDVQTTRRPLAYRFQSRGTTPTWAGKAEILPQAMTAQEQVDIEVLETEVVITQNFFLQIANKSLTNMQFKIRSDACLFEPRFFVDGLLTSAQLVSIRTPEGATAAAEPSASPGAVWNVYELNAAPALIGKSQLTIVTLLNWQDGKSNSTSTNAAQATIDPSLTSTSASTEPPTTPGTLLELPLAQPIFLSKEMTGRRTAQLLGDRPFDWLLPQVNGAGKVARVNSTTRELSSTEEVITIDVLSVGDKVAVAPVRVGVSWLQTAVSTRERRDRFVAKVRSEADQVKVRLPPLANVRDKFQILIDGIPQPDAFYDRASDALVVALPPNHSEEECTLEVFYDVRASLSSITLLDVTVPQIIDAEYVGRFYWQIATPTTQHLGWSPGELTPEWSWQWNGFWWFRNNSQDERSLVSSLGATNFEQLPPSANQYLMSGRYPRTPMRVWIASRFMLWLPIGTTAIAIAVLVLNIPFFRKPICGFVLAGVIATLGMLSPDVGVLLGQTAVIALGLVVLVFITQAAVESRVRRRSVFTTRPSTHLDGSDNYSYNRAGRASTAVTGPPGGSSVAAGGGN